MSEVGYSYFDEAYYQDGKRRGTAYVNYLESARNSPTFAEIARALTEIFAPKRVLDIGCATGTIVRRLNELGCEAHGIDVSDWAVANAEHPNVRLGSADKLRFPDGHFDLVISCHALEHIPEAVFYSSISEIARVSSRYLFHMLPMVGTPPYTGDPEEVIRNLRKDPTHQQLRSREWWMEKFSGCGFERVDHCILFRNETSTAELSTGQFWMRKSSAADDPRVFTRAITRNQRVFRDLQLEMASQAARNMSPNSMMKLTYGPREWRDIERRFNEYQPLNICSETLQLVVIADGSPCTLRVAVGRDSAKEPYADAAEFIFSVGPGLNSFTFRPDQMRILRGNPNFSDIRRVALGGEAEDTRLTCFLTDSKGNAIL